MKPDPMAMKMLAARRRSEERVAHERRNSLHAKAKAKRAKAKRGGKR
jgi:hypothetical protein